MSGYDFSKATLQFDGAAPIEVKSVEFARAEKPPPIANREYTAEGSVILDPAFFEEMRTAVQRATDAFASALATIVVPPSLQQELLETLACFKRTQGATRRAFARKRQAKRREHVRAAGRHDRWWP